MPPQSAADAGARLSAVDLDRAVARFAADMARLAGDPARIALAVSGGPDSMAMLVLATRAFPGRCIAATVDHGLRSGSAAEAAGVAVYCATIGVPHATLARPGWRPRSGVQAEARRLRYDLLARWALESGVACLITAHHADDQAETFLMRAVRGTGPAGLAGVRRRRVERVRDALPGFPQGGVVAVYDERHLPVLRPLLDWRRAELRAVVDAAGAPVVDDPSNADPRFERTRVRQLLAEHPWLDAAGLARAATHAGEANDAIEAMLDWLWRTRRVIPTGVDDPDDQTWLDMADLPRELRRRLAREAIRGVRRVNGMLPDFDLATNIEPLLDALEAGRPATQAGILVSRKDDIWRFREAPPRRAG